MNAQMTITLNESNSDAIVSIRQNGRVVEKCISVEDLATALAQMHSINTGILPSNTRLFKGDPSKYVIVIEAPAKIRRFLLHSNTQESEQGDKYKPREIMMPFPNCLFFFCVVGGNIINTYVFSTGNRLISSNDIMNYFPYGNTFEDNHVCWGKVVLPKIKNPIEIIGAVASFLDAPFNGDLTSNTPFTKPNEKVNNFWELVAYLDGQPNFPPSILRSVEITFQQALDRATLNY